MEGVTILSTTTVMLGMSLWGARILAFGSMLILWFTNTNDVGEFLGNIAVSIIAGILIFWYLCCVAVDTTEVTEYKVIIDDSVQYVEFTEKYEVIDQEGEIYTVRERIKE